MSDEAGKAELKRYLQAAREALLWKLEGVGEYDARRPLVPSGTNLLGLVKHAATTEAEYFGFVFNRPFPDPLPWTEDDAEPNADLWATAEESRESIVELYRRAWLHADATIDQLALDSTGVVPWWGDALNPVTLRFVLVHVLSETQRHAGHADIIRELVDGAIGLRQGVSNLPDVGPSWWGEYHSRVEQAARQASA